MSKKFKEKARKQMVEGNVAHWLEANGPTVNELIRVVRRDYDTLVDMVDPELRDELRSQLVVGAKRAIAEEIGRAIGASMIEIVSVLEDLTIDLGVPSGSR